MGGGDFAGGDGAGDGEVVEAGGGEDGFAEEVFGLLTRAGIRVGFAGEAEGVDEKRYVVGAEGGEQAGGIGVVVRGAIIQ